MAERALRRLHEKEAPFGGWLYGFEGAPDGAEEVPALYKLHGSVNWIVTTQGFQVRQKKWADFDKQPGYAAEGPSFPILLPYWDKKVEELPWREIWRKAAARLQETNSLIVWGYSLPVTDLKARELIRIAFGSRENLKDVCVVDPSKDVRDRWRTDFFKQRFWPYERIEDFLDGPYWR